VTQESGIELLMRVLHINPRYWPACGGAEAHLGEISERLVGDGHHVTVATTDALDAELFWSPRHRRVEAQDACHKDVRILRFPVRHLPAAPVAYAAIRRLLWLLSEMRPVPVPLMLRLARFTPWSPALWHWLENNTETFDLVAGMNICFESLLDGGLRFAERRGIPFVIYPLTHLGAGPQPGKDALSRFQTMRHQIALVRASDAVVAQTPTERRFYEEQGVPSRRILVSGPGVDPADVAGGVGQHFRDHHNLHGPLVISLSAMFYDKGTIHLVEAVRQLWREGRQLDLALAGTVLEPFRRYLARLPSADRERIHVLGFIDEEVKQDLLAAADMFVMPSRTDSFGIVYLEAWLYEKPVIGARAWGIGDVINDGEDGLLVPFGDVPALAKAIASLLENPGLRAAMGARGKQKVHRFHTWEDKYTLVKDLYCQLVKGQS
jgi:glycogen(starch) synthase